MRIKIKYKLDKNIHIYGNGIFIYFDITFKELFCGYKKVIKILDNTITGFNIGMNIGEDAGQTIFHCHIHIIPRRQGDTSNPRGGVRGVIPDKQKY